MDLHEYQAKELLSQLGMPCPPFFVASSPEEVEAIIQQQHLSQAVVKIQVHAGGRGKAGAVILCNSQEAIRNATKKLFGFRMVNRQTGPQGVIARQLLLSPLVAISKEYYVAITIDRKAACINFIVSQSGGMAVEEIAATDPSRVLVEQLDASGIPHDDQLHRISHFLGWSHVHQRDGEALLAAMAKAFSFYDAMLLEINPLVSTPEGNLVVLDAKLTIDDNALFRHKDIAAMYDTSQMSSQEALAREIGLSYVGLSGNIGCMVNGAGLAMATMDLILIKGGEPANFLDVGGGASEEKVAAGLRILFSDPHVRAILVNIFGGIMNCQIIALALKKVIQERGGTVPVPVVVRMEGTNVIDARRTISQLPVIHCDGLDEAAERVVKASQWQS
jgi:succinyl-CoA synthetase beta subunit